MAIVEKLAFLFDLHDERPNQANVENQDLNWIYKMAYHIFSWLI
jgi:hypothetical protein